jgi:hypothetical protein
VSIPPFIQKTFMKNLFTKFLTLSAVFCLSLNYGIAQNPSNTTKIKQQENKDYTEFERKRIHDNIGFTQPVEAFSLLVPKGWSVDGGIMWNQPGTVCAGNNLGIKAVSPDTKYSFELLPNFMWSYSSDPQMAQIQQQQQYPQYCAFGQPLNAEAFFKQVFAPYELGNPKIISINENATGTQALQETAAKTRQELMKYGAGQVNFYPSGITAVIDRDKGQEAIVMVGVVIIETLIPNPYNGTSSKSYTSSASERVVFTYPSGEKEKASKILAVMMGSFRTNTNWKKAVDDFWLGVRTQSNIVHIGKIKLMDEQTRQIGNQAIQKGQQNAAAMDASMRSWEASQQSQDRIHTNFVKAIREVENYRDESGTFEMSSAYNHAWSRGDGTTFLMTDSPNFDPAAVFLDNNWKQMKRVD